MAVATAASSCEFIGCIDSCNNTQLPVLVLQNCLELNRGCGGVTYCEVGVDVAHHRTLLSEGCAW